MSTIDNKYAKYSNKAVTYSSNGHGARKVNAAGSAENKGCGTLVLFVLFGIPVMVTAIHYFI